MLVVECDDVRCSSCHRHFQNHVILRIRKDATPQIVDRLLPGYLRDPIDHVVHRRGWDWNPASGPMAYIIIFREQRNGKRYLEITLIGCQQNLVAGTGG